MTSLLLLALAFLALMLYELRRRVPISLFSPVWLIIAGYLTMGIVGRYALRWAGVPWGQEFLFITFSNGALDRTLLWFLFITTSVTAGALLWIWVSQLTVEAVKLTDSVARSGGGGWLLVAFGALVLLVIGVGPENVLYRTVYLTGGGTVSKIAGSALTPVGVGLCGYIVLAFESKALRFGATIVALGYFVLAFSLATRLMALIPVLFALGAFCAQPDSRATRVLFFGSLLVTPALVPIPLVLRDQGKQGLIPFISALSTGTALFKHRGLLRMVLGQALVSFPLTTFIAQRHPLGMSVLWTSLNPMPGHLTNWYQIIPQLMVNPWTPYNTIGMLMNYGAPIGGGFYLAVGFYLGHMDWKIRKNLRHGQVLRALLLFGFSALFLLLTMEYPLRSACRLIYYSIAFEIVIALFFPEVSEELHPARFARISFN